MVMIIISKYVQQIDNAGPLEVGVQGVQLHTQYLAAFFHKLSGKKNFQNRTKFDDIRGKIGRQVRCDP